MQRLVELAAIVSLTIILGLIGASAGMATQVGIRPILDAWHHCVIKHDCTH